MAIRIKSLSRRVEALVGLQRQGRRSLGKRHVSSTFRVAGRGGRGAFGEANWRNGNSNALCQDGSAEGQ
jgi:hypothetical protein